MPSPRRRLLCSTLLTLGLLGASGCAGMSAMESGYLLGSIAGGAAAGPAGAALGSAVGSLAGAMVAKPLEQHREKTERKELEAQLGAPEAGAPPADGSRSEPPGAAASSGRPAVGSAGGGTPARIWVDERIERGHVVAGHFEQRSIPPPSTGAASTPVVASRPL